MFHTPPQHKMVSTRGTLRKQSQMKMEETAETQPATNDDARTSMTGQVKIPTSHKSKSSRTVISSSSALLAQKKKLELEAAEQKARIQMDLIDKRLAADLAAVEENYSPRGSEIGSQSNKDVENWLEDSRHELEKQKANTHGPISSSQFLPPKEDGAHGPVQQLTNALRELVTASASTKHNAHLLSRISTPRELPPYAGDPMEWLSFKNAYEESTNICNFSEQENVWRLRKCLKGPAKEAVSALLISTTSPGIIISTLELQFGNPDIIISKILYEIKKLNPLTPEYYKEIVPFSVKIKNYVASVRALKREEYLQGVSVVNVLLSKLPTILLSKWTDYSYPLISGNQKTRLDILSDFLSAEALKVSTCSASMMSVRWDNKRTHSENYSGHPRTQTVLVHSDKNELSDKKCRFCHKFQHILTDCKKFKKSLNKDRWTYVKRAGICYKCLLAKHDRQTCPAAVCDVEECRQSHHRLLHYVPRSRIAEQTEPPMSAPKETETSIQSESITLINTNNCTVLLKIVPINIHGPNGVFSAYALLDDGSTVSMMSASLAKRAGLRGRKQAMRVRGAWDTELLCETEVLDLTISNKLGNLFNINVRSVNDLCLPTQNLPCVRYEHYNYLQTIKGELCHGALKPEVLIGQDNYHLLLPLQIITGKANEPCATRTPMGWCLHGRIPQSSASIPVSQSTLFVTAEHEDKDSDSCSLQELHDDVRRYFSIESMGVSVAKPRQNADDICAWNYLENTSTLIDGKWQVGLPWRDSNCIMPDSLPTAMARLKGVEIKMKRNADYAERYHERIQHLINNNYAAEVVNTENTAPKTWYLPHFGVDNPNKRKLRLVFDAAAKSSKLSLNDYLLRGPDLLKSLFGIMLRFRENKIAVTGDIKDMFLRIKIRPEDQHALRFIFRGNPEKTFSPEMLQEPLKTYVMTSLIFGANCSPFIAQYIKNKNAQRFISSMPAAVTAIHTQHYMDDYIDSLPDEDSAIHLTKQIIHIHAQGNFQIRNWNSNSKTVLGSLPKEALGDTAVRFKTGQQSDGERTLGFLWYTEDDTLRFDLSFKKVSKNIINGTKQPTKREMLRVVMSIFDVYGFLSPLTIIGKIILQDAWSAKISWDECVGDETYTKWCKWVHLLEKIRDVTLPRHYAAATTGTSETECGTRYETSQSHRPATPTATSDYAPTPSSSPTLGIEKQLLSATSYTQLQLHIFCDASTKAFCAVAYWRWIDDTSNVRVAFIASKCRVAGNKVITIPRLELQAAVLAARLASSITKEHRMTAERRIFWSDSTTVLHWIRNNTRNYQVYIANRLGEIDDHSKIEEWRYVPTKLNVADIATRENYDCSVLENEWLHGPPFLYKNSGEWPRDVIEPENENYKLESVTILLMENLYLPVPEPARFSAWIRLLRSTSRVLTFIDGGVRAICRKFENRRFTYNMNDDIMERAERLVLIYAQMQSFSEDIALLKSCKRISTRSKLLTLSPYLDEHGVLRVGGRIDAAVDILPTMKRPVILDGKNYIAKLIVKYYHHYYAHGNQETVVNEIKQRYWITRLRPLVKTVTSQCMICRIRKSKPEVPRMGDLPYARMAHHQRPFTFCGVDLFGPMEVTVGRRREKRYGVLFTCMTVRAVHLEVVSTLATDTFIMALRRMAARRGWPHHLYSDNGTNLRGANAELKKAIQGLDEEILKNEALNHGIKWSFIPPASPHWGGAWERLIRSVKTSLKIVLKERAPKDETLNTLLLEVENIVNSRPLTHVSVDANSPETLTPNHFLIGTTSNSPQIGKFDETDLFLKKQWRISQCLADMFWRRWVREVLPELLPRKRWVDETRSLQVGDFVFVVDPNEPRNTWPKGIIEETYPGRDGRVRSVKLKTKTGILVRAAARVARIPLEAECC